MINEECGSDTCAGMNWKIPDKCPNDGKFDSEYPACQECEKDAREAIVEILESTIPSLI